MIFGHPEVQINKASEELRWCIFSLDGKLIVKIHFIAAFGMKQPNANRDSYFTALKACMIDSPLDASDLENIYKRFPDLHNRTLINLEVPVIVSKVSNDNHIAQSSATKSVKNSTGTRKLII